MLAVETPNAPTFQEHYNPDIEVIILTSTPCGSDTLEERYSFARYFGDMDVCDYNEIMEAFDKFGYYETTTPNGINGVNGHYPTTIFPATDNAFRPANWWVSLQS